MNPDTPFTTIGDEPVEARIVAWVLGEASAFEAAELERLCAERPELMIFKRRMLALHGLLGEAQTPQADESWKLPSGKRMAVADLLGGATVVELETGREKRIRRSGHRAFLAIAACLMLTVIVAGLIAPAGMRMRKKSDLTEARSNELQRQLALVDSQPRMQRLESSIPKELIKGTPRPMNVPNLEAPASGPAGAATWAAKESAAVAEADPKPQASPRPATQPAAPSSSMEKAMTANTASPATVPMPELTVDTPSVDFGDGADFGAGRGDAAGGSGGFAFSSKSAAKEGEGKTATGRLTLNRASALDALTDADSAGSGAIAGNKARTAGAAGIEVVREFAYPTEYEPPELPNAPPPSLASRKPFPVTPATPAEFETLAADERAEKLPSARGRIVDAKEQAERSDLGLESDANGRRSGDLSFFRNHVDAIPQESVQGFFAEDELQANGKIPTLGDIPVTGRLSQSVEVDGRMLELPRITTRWTPADAKLEAAVAERKSGRYDEARKLLKDGLAAEPGNQELQEELEKLDDPIRTNPALTYEHSQNVDQVRRDLYQAEGNFSLGKFDDAKREYEEVLRTDPANQAARRGMEKIAAAKSDYYRAAYDHTRAELLAEVDKAWESAVPTGGESAEGTAADASDRMTLDEYKRFDLASRVVTEEVRYKIDDLDKQAAQGLTDADYWDTSKAVAKGKASGEAGTEYEIHTGYNSEYLFRGVDRDGDKAALADNTQALAKAVRDQEDKVEERRKVLGTIARTKGIIYKGGDESKDQTREMAIKRGLDAQDYQEAKKAFESDQQLLQQMKLKLMGASMKAKPEPPKVDLAKLMEEIAASEEPYSTFSLNISDASFRIAQAALDKGERPDPAGVKVEQFYNAVDYGDPAPAADEPVACEIEQAAHPVIPGRNLVRVALKTAAAGRAATQPLHLTLLVDQSGSMTRADRRAAMDAAMASLGKLLTDKDLVNIVGFSRTSRLVADGMKGDEAGKKLATLVNQSASEGGTNLETAIDLAGQMAQRRLLAGAQNRIVLFTDGAANLGDADPQRLAAKVGQLRQQGIAFDIAGIAADGLNDELLGELARKGNGRYYVVGKGAQEDFAKQLAGAFRPAAENVKVQVRFNPERVARYKLIGFEKDRLKTEDFRNDKVDAAELAAEEAGIAIYQIEPNPGGSGEIGEVSVRFRDTASGDMVERGWTIPHDAAAPAIDRATPSMQLATLAMFAAEKLKGGPLGEAIDFRQLAEAQANVKRFFGGNARVAEVLRMVDALK